MGTVVRNRSFLLMTTLILAAGALIFGGVVAMRVAAATGATNAAGVSGASNNYVSSYGIDNTLAIDAKSAATAAEAAPVVIEPTSETPKFIAEAIRLKTPFVLLVYCQGGAADEEMLSYFKALKSTYSSSAEFFSFEAASTSKLGDTLDQAQMNVNNPPLLAIVNGEGEVEELYTGWVGRKVLEQRVSDVVRGL